MGLLDEIAKLPKLTEIRDILKNLPDENKLRLFKAITGDIVRIKGGPEELAAVYALIQLIANASMERLQAVKDITGNLAALLRHIPKGMLANLPIKEISEEIRKAIGR